MTATATAAKLSYRKTKAGEWVVFGPASVLRDAAARGTWLTVSKKSGGTDRVTILRAGREFSFDGVAMAYGYIQTKVSDSNGGGAGSARPARRSPARMCDECGERRATTTATDLSGIAGDVCGICARSGALSFA